MTADGLRTKRAPASLTAEAKTSETEPAIISRPGYNITERLYAAENETVVAPDTLREALEEIVAANTYYCPTWKAQRCSVCYAKIERCDCSLANGRRVLAGASVPAADTALLDALEPFAHIYDVYHGQRGLDPENIYTITNGRGSATLRLSDCKKARDLARGPERAFGQPSSQPAAQETP